MLSLINIVLTKSHTFDSLIFGCVGPVQSQFINLPNHMELVHHKFKCTNIVPNLWVIVPSFTPLINKLLGSIFRLFVSVNQSFSQLNHSIYNYDLINLNKLIIRGCV